MTRKVLVAGASGLVGSCAVDHFLDSDEGWEVVALSRRVPELNSTRTPERIAVDLTNRAATVAALHDQNDVTHVVYSALFEKPGLVTGWHDEDYLQINSQMLRNVLDALIAANASIEHVSTLQGTKAYGFHLGPMSSPARERSPRHPHRNFYWEQEDFVRENADKHGWRWTVLRPHLVTGGAVGVAMNLTPVVGVYATICRELDLPFGFPGNAPAPWEAVDTRVVAAALEWAALTEAAAGEIFNVTNGEVFDWRDLWPSLADTLGLDFAGNTPHPLATFLPENAEAWDHAVRRHDLRPLALGDVLGESHHLADLVFGYGLETPPPAAFVSSIKIRQAGFADCMDNEDMWRYWLHDLMRRNIIPKA
jgi:nucleoside-diphosphate-sugar epimerase